MSVSSQPAGSGNNSLHTVAGGAALILAVFLFLGASGHFAAVWGRLMAAGPLSGEALRLAFPGGVLAFASASNLVFCRGLFAGRSFALNSLLFINSAAGCYLVYLMKVGVPGHPIGTFLALEVSFILLLLAIRAGLVWPDKKAPDTG